MRIHNSRPQPKPRNAPLSAPPPISPLTPESAACLLCKGPRWLSITLATPARYEKKQEGSEAKQPACENAKGWDPQPRSPTAPQPRSPAAPQVVQNFAALNKQATRPRDTRSALTRCWPVGERRVSSN